MKIEIFIRNCLFIALKSKKLVRVGLFMAMKYVFYDIIDIFLIEEKRLLALKTNGVYNLLTHTVSGYKMYTH